MSTIPTPTRGITTREVNAQPVTQTIADLYTRTEEQVMHVTALAGGIDSLQGSVVSNHASVTQRKLDVEAQNLSGAPIADLLEELADVGFSWRQIALLTGVSVPAVRKWRQGGTVTGPNRLRVARSVALVRWIRDTKCITEVVSWLETPLMASAPLSRFDLLVGGHEDLVIESLIGPEMTPESLLDQFDPSWRTRFESDYEVFTADDGFNSIRFKHDRR